MTKEKHTILAPIGLSLIVLAGAFLLSNDTHAADYTLSLSSSSSQSIDVSNMGDKTAISADNINVATNCRYGYNLTLSTSVNNNNLYLNGNSSNNTTGTYFSPVNGTTSLKNSPNTWGYYYNSSTPTTAPTSSNVFSPVPTLSNPATIKTPLTTPSSSDINDNFNVYYGVASSDSMPVGTYKLIPDTNNSGNDGTLVYNATIADTCIAYTVHFNPTGYFEGKAITGAGTMNDQTIYEGMATPLANITFSNPTTIDGVDYYFAGWNTAQDGSGTQYINTEEVTDLATAGSNITLYAMWTDCPGGYICYNSNGANGPIVNGRVATIANQYISSATTTTVLRVNNYYHTNYGFLGWSTVKLDPDDSNYATNFSNATAAKKVYGPNETISFAAGQYTTGGLRLYAVWLPKSNTYTMQTFGETQCTNNLTKITYTADDTSSSGVSFTTENQPSITLDSFIALQDARDTNVYTVARLTDGNCWMLENLRLENTNSDNTTGNLAQGYHTDATYGNFVGLAEPETANFDDTGVANTLYSQDGSTTINIGNSDYPAYRMPRYNNSNTNATVQTSTESYKQNIYGYGNHYTKAAALANTTHYGGADAVDADGKTSETVNTSICPKGWRLPYGRSTGNGILSGGFSNLSVTMGGSYSNMSSSSTPTGSIMSRRFRQFPNNVVYAGVFSRSSNVSRTSYMYFHTSTSDDSGRNYTFYMESTKVSPGTASSGLNAYSAASIRCVAGS